MKNLDLIQEAISAIASENNETAMARLKQFITLNTPKVKGGKVKIYDWCDPKGYKSALQGVYHDQANKVAVSTNMSVLLVSKPDFIEGEDKSVVIGKKGDEIECIYPDYNRVFRKEEDCAELDIDRDKVAELLTKERADKKLGTTYFAFNVSADPDKPFYIATKYCKLLITLPEGKFTVRNNEYWNAQPLQYESNDGEYRALIMPMAIKKEFVGQDAIDTSDALGVSY